MDSQNKYSLYFDGACWPNPGGVASFGFVLTHNNDSIGFGYGLLGQTKRMSDAIAEFYALGAGLQKFLCLVDKPTPQLNIYGDSRLVLDFFNHNTKNRYDFIERRICEFHLEDVRRMGGKISFNWIPRKENQSADYLSKFVNRKIYKSNKDTDLSFA